MQHAVHHCRSAEQPAARPYCVCRPATLHAADPLAYKHLQERTCLKVMLSVAGGPALFALACALSTAASDRSRPTTCKGMGAIRASHRASLQACVDVAHQEPTLGSPHLQAARRKRDAIVTAARSNIQHLHPSSPGQCRSQVCARIMCMGQNASRHMECSGMPCRGWCLPWQPQSRQAAAPLCLRIDETAAQSGLGCSGRDLLLA